jgi:uncharacterized protein
MKKQFQKLLLLAGILIMTSNALSLELEEARSKKLVTEQPDGFIKANDPSAKSLESEINDKRRKAYEDIVKQNGNKLTLQQVGEQAAKKIQEKLNQK